MARDDDQAIIDQTSVAFAGRAGAGRDTVGDVAVAAGEGDVVTHVNDEFLDLVAVTRREVADGSVVLGSLLPTWDTLSAQLGSRPSSTVLAQVRMGSAARMTRIAFQWLDHDRDRWVATFERSADAPERRDDPPIDVASTLPSGRHLVDTLRRQLDGAPVGTVAVLVLDLGRFPERSPRLGSVTGDGVLGHVAERLEEFRVETDCIAHLGGGEFGVSISHHDSDAALVDLGMRMIDVAAVADVADDVAPLGDGSFDRTASVGIAVNDGSRTDADRLIGRARHAAREAASEATGAGRGAVVLWNAAQHVDERQIEDALGRPGWEEDIRTWFQPVVDRTGRVVAYQARPRWRQGLRIMTADQFLPVVERLGVSRLVTGQVVRGAVSFASEASVATVLVPVSTTEALAPGLVGLVTRAARDASLPLHRFCVELPASAFIADADRAGTVLDALHTAGCPVAIVGLGPGDRRLLGASLDHVTLDPALVAALPDEAAQRTVATLVGAAADAGVEVYAPGVETLSTAALLWDLDIAAIQGSVFAAASPDGSQRTSFPI